MKISTAAIGVFLASILTLYGPTSAAAQGQIGGHLGYDFGSSDLYIGPNAVFKTPLLLGEKNLLLNPEFSYYFADNSSRFSNYSNSFWLLGASLLYPLNADFADTYVGAGLLLSHASTSYDEPVVAKSGNAQVKRSYSHSRLGLDGKVGANFGKGNVRPFGEAGLVISNSSWVYIQGGARYTF